MPRTTRPAFFARLARSARLVPAAAAVLLAACGGGDGKGITEPGRPAGVGNFSGNVAGGVTRALAGVAFYGQINESGESAFAIGMGSLKPDSSFKDAVIIMRENRSLPAPGTYKFHEVGGDADPTADEFVIMSFMEVVNGQPMLCFGTGGTLTVQSSSGGRVKGSYTAQAGCLGPSDLATEVPVTLTGTFDATESSRLTVPGGAMFSRARLARTAAARR
jgi:hypothetical protein